MKEIENISLGNKYRKEIRRFFGKEVKEAEIGIKHLSESIEKAEKKRSKLRNIPTKRAWDKHIKTLIMCKKYGNAGLRYYKKLLEMSMKI